MILGSLALSLALGGIPEPAASRYAVTVGSGWMTMSSRFEGITASYRAPTLSIGAELPVILRMGPIETAVFAGLEQAILASARVGGAQIEGAQAQSGWLGFAFTAFRGGWLYGLQPGVLVWRREGESRLAATTLGFLMRARFGHEWRSGGITWRLVAVGDYRRAEASDLGEKAWHGARGGLEVSLLWGGDTNTP